MFPGKRIKMLRNELQLTQEQLGEIINVSKSNVSKYESGDLEPNSETLKLLSDYFDVSVDYLIGATNARSRIENIAAHHDGEDWTEEELEAIEDFKNFVRSRRKGEKK